jgi:hypothetical protein
MHTSVFCLTPHPISALLYPPHVMSCFVLPSDVRLNRPTEQSRKGKCITISTSDGPRKKKKKPSSGLYKSNQRGVWSKGNYTPKIDPKRGKRVQQPSFLPLLLALTRFRHVVVVDEPGVLYLVALDELRDGDERSGGRGRDEVAECVELHHRKGDRQYVGR